MFKLFFGKTNKNSSVSNSEYNQSIIDIQESLITINNNIKQIKEKDYKDSQINWKFILTTAPLYFSLLAFFAILIGAFKTHSYLNNIGYISIFSEIMSNPSTLIGIVVSYSLMVFLLSVYFSLPFFNFMILNHSNNFFKNKEFDNTTTITIKNIKFELPKFMFENLALYSIVPILLIVWGLCLYFNFDYNLSEYILWFIIIYCFIVSLYFSFKCKNFLNRIFICFSFFFIWFYSYIYPMFYAKIIVSFESREEWQWYIFLAVVAIPILINIYSFFSLKSRKKLEINKKIDDIFMGIVSVLFLLSFSFILTITTKFSDLSLYIPRFIERPTNSSWYIIHNGNTTSETINGITKGEIKYHQQFFVPNGWQQYCKDDVFNHINMQNCPTLRNKNALYGHMAWNLGNTKVFCPQSVDFFDDKDNNKEKSQKCLVIDGKYLQLISDYYIEH